MGLVGSFEEIEAIAADWLSDTVCTEVEEVTEVRSHGKTSTSQLSNVFDIDAGILLRIEKFF